jgi:hypothetical protein
VNNNDQGPTTHNNRVPSHKSGLKVDTPPPWAHLACPPPRFSSSRIPSKSPLCVCEGALCNFTLPTPANDMPQSSSGSNEARSRLHNFHIEPPAGLVVAAGLVAVAGQARHILDFIRRRQLHTTTPPPALWRRGLSTAAEIGVGSLGHPRSFGAHVVIFLEIGITAKFLFHDMSSPAHLCHRLQVLCSGSPKGHGGKALGGIVANHNRGIRTPPLPRTPSKISYRCHRGRVSDTLAARLGTGPDADRERFRYAVDDWKIFRREISNYRRQEDISRLSYLFPIWACALGV